jgi:hypothetical protein
MKAFAANFSDLSGPTNPTGIWTPQYLALKQALDRDDRPDNVLQALYNYLGSKQVEVKPATVERILELEPEQAYEAFVGLIGGKLHAAKLPAGIQATIKTAIQRLAQKYAERRDMEIAKEQEHVSGIRKRFNVESLANTLLEDEVDAENYVSDFADSVAKRNAESWNAIALNNAEARQEIIQLLKVIARKLRRLSRQSTLDRRDDAVAGLGRIAERLRELEYYTNSPEYPARNGERRLTTAAYNRICDVLYADDYATSGDADIIDRVIKILSAIRS